MGNTERRLALVFPTDATITVAHEAIETLPVAADKPINFYQNDQTLQYIYWVFTHCLFFKNVSNRIVLLISSSLNCMTLSNCRYILIFPILNCFNHFFIYINFSWKNNFRLLYHNF